MSTKSSIWYGEDERGHNVHIYWELAEADYTSGSAAPVYIEVDWEGKQTAIRLPKELAEKVLRAFDSVDGWQVL